VIVESNGLRLVGYRSGGGSFQSASSPWLHFGLGQARMAERVEIQWPSGKLDRFDNLSADTGYLIREGDNRPRLVHGFRKGISGM
jgi:hypothetical protein